MSVFDIEIAGPPGPPADSTAIADASVTNAKLANMAQATIKGRAPAAGTGDPTDLVLDTDTGLTANSDSRVPTQKAVKAAIDAVSVGTGIADDAVTNAKLANMAEATLKGRAPGAGTGDPVDLVLDTDSALAADSDSRIATQKAVKAAIAAAVVGLFDPKGSTDCSANPNYPSALKGDVYLVSVAGKIGGASGASVAVGDVFWATADNAGGTQAGVGASWDIIEHNLPDLAAIATSGSASDLSTGTVPLARLPGGVQSMPVLAAAMTPRTTSGAAAGSSESATNKIMRPTLDFDGTANEFAQFLFPMPKSWNESTVTAQFIWEAPGGTGNVIWGIQGVALSDDDVIDAAFGTAQTVTDGVTATTDVMQSAFTSAITIAGSPAEGDLVCFQVYRDAAAGGDTLNAIDAKLIGIRLNFTTNAADDS